MPRRRLSPCNAKKGHQREPEFAGPFADHNRKNKRGPQCPGNDESEQGPTPIDLLHPEVIVAREADFVGQFQEMRQGRSQRQCNTTLGTGG